TPLARAHMNVNIAFAEFAGEPVGFGLANGAPLPATDKPKGSDPKEPAPPPPEWRAAAVAKQVPQGAWWGASGGGWGAGRAGVLSRQCRSVRSRGPVAASVSPGLSAPRGALRGL